MLVAVFAIAAFVSGLVIAGGQFIAGRMSLLSQTNELTGATAVTQLNPEASLWKDARRVRIATLIQTDLIITISIVWALLRRRTGWQVRHYRIAIQPYFGTLTTAQVTDKLITRVTTTFLEAAFPPLSECRPTHRARALALKTHLRTNLVWTIASEILLESTRGLGELLETAFSCEDAVDPVLVLQECSGTRSSLSVRINATHSLYSPTCCADQSSGQRARWARSACLRLSKRRRGKVTRV